MFLKSGITMLIHNKDDIEFVTEFPCFFGHPVGLYTTHDGFIGPTFRVCVCRAGESFETQLL